MLSLNWARHICVPAHLLAAEGQSYNVMPRLASIAKLLHFFHCYLGTATQEQHRLARIRINAHGIVFRLPLHCAIIIHFIMIASRNKLSLACLNKSLQLLSQSCRSVEVHRLNRSQRRSQTTGMNVFACSCSSPCVTRSLWCIQGPLGMCISDLFECGTFVWVHKSSDG